MKENKSCLTCEHKKVCLKRSASIFMLCIQNERYNEVENAKENLDVGSSCDDYAVSAKIVFDKVVNAAADEIFGSVSMAATGNYWFGEHWNLFCEKEQLCGSTYFVVKLERYGDSEECQDFEFDTEETNIDTEVELRLAIENILRRNMFLLEEVL